MVVVRLWFHLSESRVKMTFPPNSVRRYSCWGSKEEVTDLVMILQCFFLFFFIHMINCISVIIIRKGLGKIHENCSRGL